MALASTWAPTFTWTQKAGTRQSTHTSSGPAPTRTGGLSTGPTGGHRTPAQYRTRSTKRRS
eukprot:4133998-Heterocapsa_arctica.AAC.1